MSRICDNYATHKTPEIQKRLARHPMQAEAAALSELERREKAAADKEQAAALLTVSDGADDQALAEAAKALAARRPELSGTPRDSAPPEPGGSPAGGPPPRGTAPTKPGAAGLEMALRRGYVTSD